MQKKQSVKKYVCLFLWQLIFETILVSKEGLVFQQAVLVALIEIGYI